MASTQLLQSAILGFDWPHSDAAVVHIRNIWVDSSRTTPPADEQACKQRHWDIPVVSARKALLESSIETPSDRARYLAVTSPHAGDWLKALPISSCGLRLENEVVRIGVGLRLGLPYVNRTAVSVGLKSTNGVFMGCLAYGALIGRLSRHNHINGIICRALTSVAMPVMKEPTGLIPGIPTSARKT